MKIDDANQRFELEIDGQIVFSNYRLEGQTLYIDHVEAPVALRGTGAAGKLMQAIKEHAQKQSYEIVPICGYAASWLKRHA